MTSFCLDSYRQSKETGFYYLQSRYYDPAIKRFLNADSYASTGQSFLGYNMFAFCGNNPELNIDSSGCLYIENHPIRTDETDPNGFSLDVSEEFLDPYVCLYYSYELISAYGSNGFLYGMDAERLALEIYAHAVLYYQGTYLCDKHSDCAEIPSYSDTTLPWTTGSSITEVLLYDLGSYFVEHGKDIYVNNNEKAVRMLVYKYIWSNNTSIIGRAITKEVFLETRRPKGLIVRSVQ